MSRRQGGGSHVVAGWRFVWTQLVTCLTKRLLFSARSWRALLAQIFLPVVFVTIAMVVGVLGGPNVSSTVLTCFGLLQIG